MQIGIALQAKVILQQLGCLFIFLHQGTKKNTCLYVWNLEFVCVGFFQKTQWKKPDCYVPDLLYSHLKITAMASVGGCYWYRNLKVPPQCHPSWGFKPFIRPYWGTTVDNNQHKAFFLLGIGGVILGFPGHLVPVCKGLVSWGARKDHCEVLQVSVSMWTSINILSTKSRQATQQPNHQNPKIWKKQMEIKKADDQSPRW